MTVLGSEPKSEERVSPTAELGFTLPEPARVSSGRLWVVGGLVLVGLGSAFALAYLPKRAAARVLEQEARVAAEGVPTVATISARLVSNERSLRLPGSIQPLEEAVLYSRANGFVLRWLADLGDHVKEGQLLAELDTPELHQEMSQARAAIAKARATKVQAEANRDLSKSQLERAGRLVEAGVASQQELEQNQAQSAVGDADVNVGQAAIDAEQANLRRLGDVAEYSKVTAPFAGTITARNIERGSLVTAGNGSPLFKLAATDTVRVFVQVPQDVAPSVTLDAPANVTVREFPGRTFAGRIARTAGALDGMTRTLNTEIRIDNKDGKLLSGMYVEVNLTMPSPRRVFELPATALVNDAQGVRVAVVGGDNHVHFRPIVIERDLGATLLVASGLDGSERIVQIARSDLTDGQRVKSVAAKVAPAPSAK